MTKHMVLVHGAWQGSWSFDLIKPLLERSGWQVHAVDLPGNGWGEKANDVANLASYTECVVEKIQQIKAKNDQPLVLLGHSGGGMVISQVAEIIPELIDHLVYLVGMMLPSNMTFLEFKACCEAQFPNQNFEGISPYLTFTDHHRYSTVSIEGALKIFLQDCMDPVLAMRLAKQLKPQQETGRDLRLSLSKERYGAVPRLYIEALEDQSLALNMQRLMQQLQPDCAVLSMDTGHVPQAIQPHRLVQYLNEYLMQSECRLV